MGLLFGQIYLGKQLLHYPQILGLLLCYDKMRRPFGECAIASCNCPCNFVFRYIQQYMISLHKQLQSLLDKLFSIGVYSKNEKVNQINLFVYMHKPSKSYEQKFTFSPSHAWLKKQGGGALAAVSFAKCTLCNCYVCTSKVYIATALCTHAILRLCC